MKAVFDTIDYGRIEVDQEPGRPGTAYFGLDDTEAEIQPDGSFKSLYGTTLQVRWPRKAKDFATLDVVAPRIIALARPR